MAIHVAVVDDDQAVRSRISDFLKRYGEEKGVNWNISFFKTGTEFLFQYQAKYDVIMLDIEMPVLNGLDVARRIRKVAALCLHKMLATFRILCDDCHDDELQKERRVRVEGADSM